MRFGILGPFQVNDGVRDLTPTAPKLRGVLAMLVIRNRRLVRITELVDELWGEMPPASALSTLQTYIYKLRKILAVHGADAEQILQTRPYGYQVAVPDTDVDLLQFERLADAGRAALAEDPPLAARTLAEALSLWRGPALADVPTGDVLSAYITRLEEARVRALEWRIEADLQLGQHDRLIGELTALAAIHPMHEGFHAKLMLAMHRSGRRGEALEHYQRLRRGFVDELGLEPSPPLQSLQRSILASDPALDLAVGVLTATLPPAFSPPAQLPSDISDFVGRAELLERLQRRLAAGNETHTAVPLVAITGMPGVGKSVLAVHLAHRVRTSFPDGQLFVSLRRSTGEPISASECLEGILRAIGVARHDVPASLEQRSNLFRTRTADRDLLIVLDDALSAAQVSPLLPGSPRCAAIVTSRFGLHGLAGAQVVELDPLAVDEGVQLLATMVGWRRIERERHAAESIVRLCGSLPLALRSAGARLAAARGWPLGKLVEHLSAPYRRLDELRFADLDVRARYDSSYSCLAEPEKNACRLLALWPAANFTSRQVSALLGSSVEATEGVLMRLVEQHFLRMQAQEPAGEIRFAFHELAFIYARERVEAELQLASSTARGTEALAASESRLDWRATTPTPGW